MNQILMDEEVSEITGVGFEATGRAIEQAILNKLSDEKPVGYMRKRDEQQKLIESQAAEIEKYKALCDQMGMRLN